MTSAAGKMSVSQYSGNYNQQRNTKITTPDGQQLDLAPLWKQLCEDYAGVAVIMLDAKFRDEKDSQTEKIVSLMRMWKINIGLRSSS